MNPAKVTPQNYIDLLIASPKSVSAVEAARVQPAGADGPAHDAFTRLLQRLEPDPEPLWEEARILVHRTAGVLVLDDTVLDKPHARRIELVGRHWSGKHHRVVQGIDLVTLVWTDGDRIVPCDYRIYHDSKQATKHDLFREMLHVAKQRGFGPECVLFDGWYACLENLKFLRDLGWNWLTRLKANRLVSVERKKARPLSETEISAAGTNVWLPGYGLVRVFKIVATDGDIAYWACSDLESSALMRQKWAELSWSIENFHRGVKQCTEVERCQARSARAQRNHIGFALRAFLRLEHYFYTTGVSWYEAKTEIVRSAVRNYLAGPTIVLPTA